MRNLADLQLSCLCTLSLMACASLTGCQHPPKPFVSAEVPSFCREQGLRDALPTGRRQQHECPSVTGYSNSSNLEQLLNEKTNHVHALAELVATSLAFRAELRDQNLEAVSQAYLIALEVTVHNLEHAQTTGFKRCRVQFRELVNEQRQAQTNSQSPHALARESASTLQLEATAVALDFEQGELIQTGECLDLAIQGNGMLEVELPDGRLAYTRDGCLRIASDGRVITSAGFSLQSGFGMVPQKTTAISISPDGDIVYSGNGSTVHSVLTLARFRDLSGLEPLGNGLFLPTPASGDPILSVPGKDGCGQIHQGFLESSNVSVAEELKDLIRRQRTCLGYKEQVHATSLTTPHSADAFATTR